MFSMLLIILSLVAFLLMYFACQYFFDTKSAKQQSDLACCVFSGFEGKLLFKGRPAVGARIVRKVEMDDSGRVIMDDTTSSGLGLFSFTAIHDVLEQHGMGKLIMHQDMFVYYRGKKYHIWQTSKHCEKEFTEFGGQPSAFTCELTDEERFIDIQNATCIISNANWLILKA